VETQRQWSELAIAQTTQALLGLFSLITLWAVEAKVAAVLHPRSARQRRIDVQRRHRCSQARLAERIEFIDISEKPRHHGNSDRLIAKTYGSALLRDLKI
jgi:hypothetical protein